MPALPRTALGIRSLIAGYDAFVVDQWGVLHDGHHAHDGARDALDRLRAHGPVVLVSNTSRRVAEAQARATALGFPPEASDGFITAGELAARWLEQRIAQHNGVLAVYSLLGPPPEDSLVFTTQAVVTPHIDEAHVVLAAGVSRGPADAYDGALAQCQARGLPMLVANPDHKSIQPDGSMLLCPGTFADRYATLGGTVHATGKPSKAIYEAAFPGGPPGRVLTFGDSLHHDVRGAQNIGQDAVLVTRGIHAPELFEGPSILPDAAAVAELADAWGTRVSAAVPTFTW